MDKPLTVPLRFPFPAPTHNLTLSRAAREIVELNHKLHDAYPTLSRPALPIDRSALARSHAREVIRVQDITEKCRKINITNPSQSYLYWYGHCDGDIAFQVAQAVL